MKQGDREAARILIRLFASAVYARAFSRTGDLDRAKKAVVRTFVDAFRRVPSLNFADEFPTLLSEEAGSASFTHARGAPHPPGESDGLLPAHHSLAGSAKLRAHRAARERLGALEPPDRAIGLLAFVQGMKSAEIAATLNESAEEVRRSLGRITLRLDSDLRAVGKQLEHDFGLLREPTAGWRAEGCNRPVEVVLAHAEGEHGAAGAPGIVEHLAGCARCREMRDRMTSAREVLDRQLQHYRLGETFPNEVLEALGPLAPAALPFKGAAAGWGCLVPAGIGVLAGLFLSALMAENRQFNYNRPYGGYGYGGTGVLELWYQYGVITTVAKGLLSAVLLGLSLVLLPAGWPTSGGGGRRLVRSTSRILLGVGGLILLATLLAAVAGRWTLDTDSAEGFWLLVVAGQIWPAVALGLAALHAFYAFRDFATEIRAIAERRSPPPGPPPE